MHAIEVYNSICNKELRHASWQTLQCFGYYVVVCGDRLVGAEIIFTVKLHKGLEG